MKPATQFHSSFPPHLLTVVPQMANTAQNDVASVVEPRQYVWPQLDFKASMDNFRLFKAEHNRQLRVLNKAIKKHNEAVAAHKEAHPATESKMVLINLFKSKHGHLFTFTDCTFTSSTAQEAGGSLDSERVRDIRQSDIRSIDL